MARIGKIMGRLEDRRTYAVDNKWPLPDCCIGLELEYEGADNKHIVIREVAPELIDFHHDPSLRGENVELRFFVPLSGVDLSRAFEELEKIVKSFERANGQTLILNNRTSLHVHLDVRNLELEDFRKLQMLFSMFERVLFKYCTPSREYNNFCLPSYRAEDLRGVQSGILTHKSAEDWAAAVAATSKYLAINYLPIKQFGSVEIRMHQGTLDMSLVAEWVCIIQCIKKAAIEMKFANPVELLTEVSRIGGRKLGEQVFGKWWKVLDYAEAELDILSGARAVQDLLLYRKLNYVGTAKASVDVVEKAIKAANNA